jgi:sodium-dependent dicarboxylate transporter 2/3/5
VGGIGTPAGTGANPIALRFLSTMAGINLSFLDWMVYGVPSALLIMPVAWLVLMLFFPPEMKHLKVGKSELKAQFKAMPPMSREEIITLVVFLLTVAYWILSPILGAKLGLPTDISLPALLAACLFFVPGMSKAKWKDIEKEIDWAGIFLIVSGLSLGMYLYKTGAAEWMAIILLSRIGEVPLFLQLFMVTLGICLLKVVFSSNTVTATILIPLIIGLGKATGMDVTGITMAAGLTTSLAFILVTSTPTNVIPFNTGYFSIKDMAKAGVVLTIGASAVIAVVFMGIYTIKGGF